MKARKRKNRFYRIWQKQIARNAKMLRLVYGKRRKSKLVARAKICSKGKRLLVNKWVQKLNKRYPNGFEVDKSLHRKAGDI